MRKRLLFISDVVPDPLGTGSEQRAYTFAKAYSKWFRVELWCHPRKDNPALKRLSRLRDVIEEVYAFYPGCKLGPLSSAPLIESATSADIVHLFKFPLRVSHPCLIWDIDELPPQFHAPYVTTLSSSISHELDPVVKSCVEQAQNCRTVMVSSSLEMSPHLNKMVVIPNCVEADLAPPKRKPSRTVLFVGHLGYPPNLEAIVYFCKRILPLLPQEFRLRVIGKSPLTIANRTLLEFLNQESRISVHFDVPDCRPHYNEALASVVPLLSGSGTRLKILESFANNCPVVSTTKGCEGLNLTNGRHLLINDNPTDFAASIQRLATLPSLGNELACAAQEHLLQHHSINTIERELHAALQSFAPELFTVENTNDNT